MLRTEKVKIGEREIEVKEFSAGAQLRIEKIENKSFSDMLKECISPDDYAYLDNVPREEIIKLIECYNRVNDVTFRQ